MKIGMYLALIFSVIAVSTAAKAQETTPVELPPDVAACMNKCLATTSCTCSGTPAAATPDPRIADLQRQVVALQDKFKPKPGWKPGPDRIKLLKEELQALEARVLVLEGKPDGASKADIDALKASLDGLRSDLDSLKRRVDLIEKDGAANTVDITLLKPRVDDHERRIEKLELTPPAHLLQPRGITFGFRTGFLGLHSYGTGTDYTALPLLANLRFPLSDKVTIMTEAGVAVSDGEHGDHVGVMLRGAVQYRLADHWEFNVGAASVWTSYDTQLRAKYATFLGDVGPSFNYGILTVNASLLAGPSFEPRGTSFALGGIGLIGIQLP